MSYQNRRRLQAPYFTKARFDGICAETGQLIHRGDAILYNPTTKQVFCDSSQQACDKRAMDFAQSFDMADANW